MAERPIRIQLKRTLGWKMPPNTVKVDRSTKWGNPWRVGEWGPLMRNAPDAEGAVGLFLLMLADPEMRRAAGYPEDLSPLRGKNLACWCKLGEPCHADVLLAFANGEHLPLGSIKVPHPSIYGPVKQRIRWDENRSPIFPEPLK